jgi:phosphoheptose isomerase
MYKKKIIFIGNRGSAAISGHISSSRRLPNILKATKWHKRNKIKFITFSGNDRGNPLKKINSQGINFLLDYKAYNYIEGMHLLLLMRVTGCIIGKSVCKP